MLSILGNFFYPNFAISWTDKKIWIATNKSRNVAGQLLEVRMSNIFKDPEALKK